eukprot:245667_1
MSNKPSDIQPLMTIGNDKHSTLNKKKYAKFGSICLLVSVVIGLLILILWSFGDSSPSNKSGPIGKFPFHGGNTMNQQIALNSKLTAENMINSLSTKCIFNYSTNYGTKFSGYITIDNNNRAYWSDMSGYVFCIDINSCSEIWRINISEITHEPFSNRNTMSLFQDSNGNKGALFGTNYAIFSGSGSPGYSGNASYGCYAIALNIKDGSLMWKTKIQSFSDCFIHGFMIENNFAFGGVSSMSNQYAPNIYYSHIGKVVKININNGHVVNEWYSLNKINTTKSNANTGYYSGASVWPIHAIIDEYYVFTTGNLVTYPKYIEECMLGNTSSVPLENARPHNICGEDMSEYVHWRCLENDIHTDSLVIMNKNTFELERNPLPFSGVDIWNNWCWYIEVGLYNFSIDNFPQCTAAYHGPDADPAGIALYHDHNGIAYAAISSKSGYFYIIEIPSGNVKVSKKVGPYSFYGGGDPFSIAVDEENMIAIYSIKGTDFPIYRYEMADGTIVCDMATVHAINLTNGYTIWQWINPWGKIGIQMCNDTVYDEYIDMTVNGSCERAFDGSHMLSPNQTVINVVRPSIDNLLQPFDAINKPKTEGIVTIVNNMVFIPTITGEIFVHNIFDGQHIHTLQCPDYLLDIYGNGTLYNMRHGVRGGVTMYDEKIVFFGGSQNDKSIVILEVTDKQM